MNYNTGMTPTYWHKQTTDKPLFPDLIWGRPENRQAAGKLLIVGGNLHGFAAPAEAYQVAIRAGVGSCRVLLPDALKKTVGKILDIGEYAPSNPSGSFSQKSLDEMLAQAAWADGVLIAGDLGKNSETAVAIEKFMAKWVGQVTLTKDAVDYVTSNPQLVQNRTGAALVLSLSQLQRLFTALKSPLDIALSMGLPQLVDALHDFTQTNPVNIIVKHLDNILVAVAGQVSTTAQKDNKESWRVDTSARTAVWWLQNPSKPFEALSTSLVSKN